MATYIKQKTEEGSLGNYAAHGLLGAGVAALQGNSALAGAAGAAGGEFVAHEIVNNFYDGKDTKDLTESEKENISNWSQIASGAAAFAGSGGSLNNVSTAVSASKNAVENNALSDYLKTPTPNPLFAIQLLFNVSELGDGTRPLYPDELAAIIATAPNEKAEFLTGSDTDKPIKNHTGDTEGLGTVDLPTNTGHGSGLDGIDIPSHTGDTEGLGSVTIPNNTGHDGGLNDVDIKNDTGGEQILDNSWQDNILTSQKPYEPNKGSVGNMGEFLGQSGFGSDVKDNSSKTSKQYQGQSIYTADKPIGDTIKTGDRFYLDGQHKNHIEVFSKNGDFKAVLNLDGTVNEIKTNAARKRKLK